MFHGRSLQILLNAITTLKQVFIIVSRGIVAIYNVSLEPRKKAE